MSMETELHSHYTRQVPTFLSNANGDDGTRLTVLQNPVEYICDTDADEIFLPPEGDIAGMTIFIVVTGADGTLAINDAAGTLIDTLTPAAGTIMRTLMTPGNSWWMPEGR